jgi:hypothetical protein
MSLRSLRQLSGPQSLFAAIMAGGRVIMEFEEEGGVTVNGMEDAA